jgi:hypothetical protein
MLDLKSSLNMACSSREGFALPSWLLFAVMFNARREMLEFWRMRDTGTFARPDCPICRENEIAEIESKPRLKKDVFRPIRDESMLTVEVRAAAS